MNIKQIEKYHIPIIAFAALIIYASTLNAGFICYDDIDYLLKNRYLTGEEKCGIGMYFQPGFIRNDIYIPLSFLIFRILFIIAGKTAWVFHAASIIFYSSSCIAFYFLVRRLLPSDKSGFLFDMPSLWERWLISKEGRKTAAFGSAIIYTALPCHVENAAWISALGYGISSTCFFTSFILLIETTEKYSLKKMLSAAALAVAAVMSQPAASVLPLVFAAWVLCFRKNHCKKALPIAAVIGKISAVYALMLKAAIAGTFRTDLDGLTLIDRTSAFGRNIFNMILPADLMISYPTPSPAFSIITAIFIFIFVLSAVRKQLMAFFLCLAFLMSILPYANIFYTVPFINQDRYLMIPSCWWSIGLVCILASISSASENGKKASSAIFAMALAAYTALSASYAYAWSSSLSLMELQYSKNPYDPAISEAYCEMLRNEKMYEKALETAEFLNKTYPQLYRPYKTRAICLERLGEYERMEKEFSKAAEEGSHFGWLFLSEALFMQGKYAESLESIRTFFKLTEGKTISGDSKEQKAMLFKIAGMNCSQKDMFECLPELAPDFQGGTDMESMRSWLKSNPQSQSSRYVFQLLHISEMSAAYGDRAPEMLRKSIELAAEGDRLAAISPEEAEKKWKEAVKTDPYSPDAYIRLAIINIKRHNNKEAEKYAVLALKANPADKNAKELSERIFRNADKQHRQ